MKPHSFEYIPTTHTYLLDSREVPSVSRIIKATVGHGYPKLQDAEARMRRGQAAHACYDFVCRGIEFDYDPECHGYVEGCRKFLNETKPTITRTEFRVYSARLQYAGTLDALAVFPGMDRPVIVDWKGALTNRAGLQLAAYAIALEEMAAIKVAGGIAVEIPGDGSYRTSHLFDLKQERREWPALRSTYAVLQRLQIKERETEQ